MAASAELHCHVDRAVEAAEAAGQAGGPAARFEHTTLQCEGLWLNGSSSTTCAQDAQLSHPRRTPAPGCPWSPSAPHQRS